METEVQVLEGALKAIRRAKMASPDTLRDLAGVALEKLGRAQKARLPSRLVLAKQADSEEALETERQYTRELEQSAKRLDKAKRRVEVLIDKYLTEADGWDKTHAQRDSKHAIECDCGLMAREYRDRARELRVAISGARKATEPERTERCDG